MRYTTIVTAILGLALSVSACTTPAPTEDTKPTENAAATIPAYAPLVMDEAFSGEVTNLGDHDGVAARKVGDLVILHKRTPANQVVSAQLYFLDAPSRLAPNTQGIEKFALSVAVDGGTESTPKDELNAKLASVGASIGSFTDRDYSGVAMKTISPYFDDVWTLFEQVVLEPAMPESEVELVREQQMASILGIEESADSLVSHITAKAFFDGHQYADTQQGVAETVSKFTRDELRGYQRSLVSPNRMLLVVVGDVPTDDLVAKVSAKLARVKSSAPAAVKPTPVERNPDAKPVTAVKEGLPTNYIFGLFPAPAPDHPDYAPMVVGMDFLSDRLFEEVRTKRNLTYAVSAGISSRMANYGYFYVTAADPGATLPVMFDEVSRITKDGVSQQQLDETLNVFITQYYMGQETNSSQASALADAYILTGDFKRASAFLGELKAVAPEDVKRVFGTYVKDVQFGVVGAAPDSIDPTLFDR